MPQYWKNGNIYDLPGGPWTYFGKGAAYDIRVSEGDIIVAGIATRDSSYYDSYTSACYWLNGQLYYLVNENDVPQDVNDWHHSYARGISIE